MIVRLAAASSVPEINGLSDYCHPCQALADIYTLRERVGRLAVVCGLIRMRFVRAAPPA